MVRKQFMRLILFGALTLFVHCGYCTDLPAIHFIENKGQWKSKDLFLADVGQGRMGLQKDRFRFYLYGTSADVNRKNEQHQFVSEEYESHHTIHDKLHVYDIRFLNTKHVTRLETGTAVETRYHYFYGNDKKKWISNANGFVTIYYRDIYNGINLKVFSQGMNVKYEWYVAPMSDPNQILLQYDGADEIYLSKGNLVIRTSVGESTELKPFACQIKNGRQVIVPSVFKIDNNKVSYSFPEGYDECEELIIDPILIFSAYSGSSRDNWGNTATYDSRGNAYSGGIVSSDFSGVFPVTTGAYQLQHRGGLWDVGILKYDSAGSKLLYATYIGGNSTEIPQSLVVNSKDELLILGVTGSNNLPVTNGSVFKGGSAIDPLDGVPFANGSDIFVTKLSADGSQLLGATYLGGSNNDGVNFIAGSMGDANNKIESPLARNYGDQLRGDIITGENDTVFVASNTLSNNFSGCTNIFSGGSHDAVVIKLAPDLTHVVDARYLGGSGTDVAYSLKLHNQEVFIGGGTNSNNLPNTNGLIKIAPGGIDGWVAALRMNDLAVMRATYLGTSSYDQVYFIDLNLNGEVYAFGQTRGQYPVHGNVFHNANGGQFIHKLDAGLSSSLFSTVIGSANSSTNINPNISPTAFLVSDCNNSIFLSGWGGIINAAQSNNIIRNYVGGSTHNMPISPGALQANTTGSDFYLMVLSDDAKEFTYGTYLGGTISLTHVDGGTSRFDKQGIVYHAVCAGCGGSSDFPAVNVPQQYRTNNSSNCNNAVFKFDLAQLKATVNAPAEICFGETLHLEDNSMDGILFEWDFGDGTKKYFTTPTDVSHVYKSPGNYEVKFVVSNPNSCIFKDSVILSVEVYDPQIAVQDDDRICEGDDYTLQASGGISYQWFNEDQSLLSTAQSPTVNPKTNAIYYVTVTGNRGCVMRDTVEIGVVEAINLNFTLNFNGGCEGMPTIVYENTTDSLSATDQLIFYWSDGSSTDSHSEYHNYEKEGVYQVLLIATREFCVWEKTAEAISLPIKVPNVITPETSIGLNDSFQIQLGYDQSKTPLDFNFKTSLQVYDRWGGLILEDNDYQHNWKATDLAAGVYYYDVQVENYLSCRSWLHVIR